MWQELNGLLTADECRQVKRELAGLAESEHRVRFKGTPATEGDLVYRSLMAQVGPFTLADLSSQITVVSVQLVRKVLAQMKKAGRVCLAGRSRGARREIVRSR